MKSQTPAAKTPFLRLSKLHPRRMPCAEVEVGADEAGLIQPAVRTSLGESRWTHRPVVVFADGPNDPRYIQQIENFTERLEALVDRDVIVITDTDPAARSSIRQFLRLRGFMVVVMGKDGTIILRKSVPLSPRESRTTSPMP